MTTAVLRLPSRLFQNILNKRIISPVQNRFLTSPEKVSNESTIDASDVAFFSKETKEWWDVNGPFKGLHSFNLLRVPFVRDGIVQCKTKERRNLPLKDIKILDVGCGGGILSEGLARLGANVTGIDASSELIEVAEDHKKIDPRLENYRPTYLHSTVEDHAIEHSNHYDAVVASEVIEHVNNKELFVKSCVDVLKPGGRIFFTTPNRTRLAKLLVIYAAENIFHILPKGTHEYEKFVTPNELTFLLERNNCHVEASYGLFHNIVMNIWHYTRSQELMFALQAVKLESHQ